MLSNDVDYYRRRAAEERARAEAADRRAVAEIHLELACQFEALIEQKELRASRSA